MIFSTLEDRHAVMEIEVHGRLCRAISNAELIYSRPRFTNAARTCVATARP